MDRKQHTAKHLQNQISHLHNQINSPTAMLELYPKDKEDSTLLVVLRDFICEKVEQDPVLYTNSDIPLAKGYALKILADENGLN